MLKTFWEKWKALAEKIGDFQFSLIFSVLYYLLVVPFGFVANIVNDLLKLRGFPKWEKVERDFESIKDLKEQ